MAAAEAARVPDRNGEMAPHCYLEMQSDPNLEVMQLLVEAYPESVIAYDSRCLIPLYLVSRYSGHEPTLHSWLKCALKDSRDMKKIA